MFAGRLHAGRLFAGKLYYRGSVLQPQPETPPTVAAGGSRPQREPRPARRHDDDEAFLLAVLL